MFPIKVNPVFSNGPKNLRKNPPDCTIWCNWVFESFILADEPLEKALLICVLVNCNLCGKLFASWEFPTTFDEMFKVTLVPFFSADFNLLSCELNKFTFLN